jgi:hypothetical protein
VQYQLTLAIPSVQISLQEDERTTDTFAGGGQRVGVFNKGVVYPAYDYNSTHPADPNERALSRGRAFEPLFYFPTDRPFQLLHLQSLYLHFDYMVLSV